MKDGECNVSVTVHLGNMKNILAISIEKIQHEKFIKHLLEN